MEREQGKNKAEIGEKAEVSLRDLVKSEVKRRKHTPGMRVSERVIWLSEAIESVEFWDSLDNLIEKDKSKRQSLGGIFTRELGKEKVGPYTFKDCFNSLDVFLKPFGYRATEFIFRDFVPGKRAIRDKIEEVRHKAFDKYPRVRRLYWKDYQDLLNGSLFWRNIVLDLQEITRPVSYENFFGWPDDIKNYRKTHVEENLNKLFWYQQGQPGKIARTLQYRNLAQIVRDMFHIDTRTFLLRYKPSENYQNLFSDINKARVLIERKILPPSNKRELKLVSLNEFEKTIANRVFWRQLIEDLEKYRDSDIKTSTFSYFLRYFDSDSGKIIPNRNGSYSYLATVFIRSRKGLREKMPKAASRVSEFLLWRFRPSDDLKDLVSKVKELCSEFFPQDCLYLALQTQKFWQEFLKDLNRAEGRRSFCSFLRYFSTDNLHSDSFKHKKRNAKYQRFLQRAYHKQDEFKNFLSYLKIECQDYKEGIIKLFWMTAPDEVKKILQKKFLSDFNLKKREEKNRQSIILSYAKALITRLDTTGEKEITLEFSDKASVLEFRKKLWSASKFLKKSIKTRIKDNLIKIVLSSRLSVPLSERERLEKRVMKMRQMGLKTQEIARRLKIKNHNVEWIVTKLIKSGKILSRKEQTRRKPFSF